MKTLNRFATLAVRFSPLAPYTPTMIFELSLCGAMAIGLGGYLLYALLHPEKF